MRLQPWGWATSPTQRAERGSLLPEDQPCPPLPRPIPHSPAKTPHPQPSYCASVACRLRSGSHSLVMPILRSSLDCLGCRFSGASASIWGWRQQARRTWQDADVHDEAMSACSLSCSYLCPQGAKALARSGADT